MVYVIYFFWGKNRKTMCVCVCVRCCFCLVTSVMSNSIRPYRLQPARLLSPWDSLGEVLEWVAIPSSRGSSWPRNRTPVSCIAGRFFTAEAPEKPTHTHTHTHTHTYSAAAAKSLQSCSTLWDPTDGSPPGSSVPGILQARTLEWVAISFSNARKGKGKVTRLLVTPWTAAY